MFDYDWGPQFNYARPAAGIDNVPPTIKQVIPMKVPRTDADGNELGGVPVVLRDAPLGTYLGWNITAAGFHKGQICNYTGGWIPFATTHGRAPGHRRPAPVARERYRNHDGYVRAVTAAADNAFGAGLPAAADRDALIAAAEASNVLNVSRAHSKGMKT